MKEKTENTKKKLGKKSIKSKCSSLKRLKIFIHLQLESSRKKPRHNLLISKIEGEIYRSSRH